MARYGQDGQAPLQTDDDYYFHGMFWKLFLDSLEEL